VSDDPLRMYLVVRRGSFDAVAGGAAAVGCVRRFAEDPDWAEAVGQWRPRPGKVCVRARTESQWRQVLELPHAGTEVVALPPRRRSEREPLLQRLQAHSGPADLPSRAVAPPGAMTYLVNPEVAMTAGKVGAQVAHAAVMAADSGRAEDWVQAGCPGVLLAPPAEEFARACARPELLTRVEDAGLTEVPPGTVTVLAIAQP